MPKGRSRRSNYKRKRSSNFRKSVAKIAKAVTLGVSETKHALVLRENTQLFHNVTSYHPALLSTQQGLRDDDTSFAGSPLVRVGDELILKSIRVRFWLSTKLDRPNVIFKGFLFWYNTGLAINDLNMWYTNTNKMLDLPNAEKISVIDSFIVRPGGNYSVNQGANIGKEHSYLAALGSSWKGKKIQYAAAGIDPKKRNLGMMLVCYDAFGTLQTDNIASYAWSSKIAFKDP